MTDRPESAAPGKRRGTVTISKRLVVINSASSLLAKIANVTVLLWAYQYLLKRIPAEEFAVLPVVTAIMVAAPLFFSFFTGGVSRYVVDAYAKGEFDRVTGIVSSILPFLAATTAVFCAAGFLLAANIEQVLNIAPGMVDDGAIMMALLVASFALQMLTAPLKTGYFVHQRFVELNLLEIARDGLKIVLLVTLLVGVGPQVIWVVVATVAAEVVHTVVTTLRSVAMVPELRFRPALYDGRQARELMSFGMWTALGRLGDIFYTNAATILLNLYGSAVDVTNYHIGATIFRQIDSTISRVIQPLTPVLTAMHALEDRARMARTVFRGGRYGLWAVLAVAVPLIVYADDFIALYLGDAAYSQAALVIVFFMLIFPFTKAVALLSMTAMATAQVRAFHLPAFLSKILMFAIMLWLAMSSDLGAVALTLSLTVVTVAMQVGYYWPLCLKLTGTRWRDFASQVLVPGVLPALAGAVVWVALKLLAPPDSWTALFGYSILGGLVYIAVLLGFCLSTQERKELSGLLSRFRSAG